MHSYDSTNKNVIYYPSRFVVVVVHYMLDINLLLLRL